MAAKFLCCLPLRFGVLVIAFIQFIVTGAAAALVCLTFFVVNKDSQLTEKLKASIIVIGAVYTVSAFISLVGFIGALAKKLGAIRAYLFVLYATLVLQITATVYILINYYHLKPSSDQDCVVTSNGTEVNWCDEYKKVPQAAVIVTAIVPILIQMYACYIVSAYKNRLLNQKYHDKSLAMDLPEYSSVPVAEHGFTAPHADISYIYGGAAHSFGKHGKDFA